MTAGGNDGGTNREKEIERDCNDGKTDTTSLMATSISSSPLQLTGSEAGERKERRGSESYN